MNPWIRLLLVACMMAACLHVGLKMESGEARPPFSRHAVAWDRAMFFTFVVLVVAFFACISHLAYLADMDRAQQEIQEQRK